MTHTPSTGSVQVMPCVRSRADANPYAKYATAIPTIRSHVGSPLVALKPTIHGDAATYRPASRARPNVNARSSTRRRGRSWHAEPTNQGVDQLMNGLYSFCNLSVMQQNFWARCHPSICSKITPVFGMPATKIGRRTSGYRTKARAKPSQPLRPTVWIAVASRPGCSPSFAASDVPPLRRHRRTQQESRRHE